MRNAVRLSLEVPVEDHIFIKIECAKARISMKDFLEALVLEALKELKDKHLMGRLKKSIQQAKDGKVTTMSLSELEKFIEEDE